MIAPEHVKGHIYIEAYKQSHVKQVIEGISALRLGIYQQQMVPIKEMTDVLRVVKEQTGLRPKQWVRLKRGIFKDDLAQVRKFSCNVMQEMNFFIIMTNRLTSLIWLKIAFT